MRQHTSSHRDVIICQHVSAYVSIRHHTSTYVNIRQNLLTIRRTPFLFPFEVVYCMLRFLCLSHWLPVTLQAWKSKGLSFPTSLRFLLPLPQVPFLPCSSSQFTVFTWVMYTSTIFHGRSWSSSPLCCVKTFTKRFLTNQTNQTKTPD